jgi:Transposase DDE domain
VIAYIDTSVLLRVALGQSNALPEWRQIDRGITSALTRVEGYEPWTVCDPERDLGIQRWPADAQSSFNHESYRISQRKRKRIEECFGWLKTIALLRKVRHRGLEKVDWVFVFACAAYNLVRLRNLSPQPA